MTKNLWTIGPDSKSVWADFGPYQLQGVRADDCEGETLAACIQITDCNGATVAELELPGDPSLHELTQHAVKFAGVWLGDLNAALARISK